MNLPFDTKRIKQMACGNGHNNGQQIGIDNENTENALYDQKSDPLYNFTVLEPPESLSMNTWPTVDKFLDHSDGNSSSDDHPPVKKCKKLEEKIGFLKCDHCDLKLGKREFLESSWSGGGCGSDGSGPEFGNGSSGKSSISASANSSPKSGVKSSGFAFEDLRGSSGDFTDQVGSEMFGAACPLIQTSISSIEITTDLKIGKRACLENSWSTGSEKSPLSVISTPSTTAIKKMKPPSLGGSPIPRCQVEGCNLDLSSAKDYHRKHRVCEDHSKSSKVIVKGVERRFCQQYSRFHGLSEFDHKKRSCRRRLSDHNARCRKPQQETIAFNSSRLPSFYVNARLFTRNMANNIPLFLVILVICCSSYSSSLVAGQNNSANHSLEETFADQFLKNKQETSFTKPHSLGRRSLNHNMAESRQSLEIIQNNTIKNNISANVQSNQKPSPQKEPTTIRIIVSVMAECIALMAECIAFGITVSIIQRYCYSQETPFRLRQIPLGVDGYILRRKHHRVFLEIQKKILTLREEFVILESRIKTVFDELIPTARAYGLVLAILPTLIHDGLVNIDAIVCVACVHLLLLYFKSLEDLRKLQKVNRELNTRLEVLSADLISFTQLTSARNNEDLVNQGRAVDIPVCLINSICTPMKGLLRPCVLGLLSAFITAFVVAYCALAGGFRLKELTPT